MLHPTGLIVREGPGKAVRAEQQRHAPAKGIQGIHMSWPRGGRGYKGVI